MKNLFMKELKLVISPAVYLFSLLSLMLLIPGYPYWVGVFYCFLGINVSFMAARANKDNEFTIMLPVPRKHIVLSKIFNIVITEAVQILVAIPCALISSLVINKSGNIVGMDANIAFFGMVLIAYTAFNMIFLPIYFNTGYKSGLPLILGMIAFFIVCLAIELIVQFIPPLKNALDTLNPQYFGYQIIVLVIGAAIYLAGLFVSYKVSVKNFEKINL